MSSRAGADESKIVTRTSEGLTLDLHVVIYFQYQKENLHKLYPLCYKDCRRIFVQMAKNTILEAAGTYIAPTYWTDRKKIQGDILKTMNETFDQIYLNIESLQIMKIDLPDSYENAIVLTQVMI